MPAKSDPVWILFRRRTFSRLAYWLKVLGFDPRDRSINNLFYSVYFYGFWVAWGVAVFAILGASMTKIFVFLPGLSPNALVIQYSAIFFFVWGLIKFWQVVRRSPFVFSEPDAYLLCQAPLDRWKVGLGWFLMDWFGTGLVFAAGSIILAFALTYKGLSGASAIQDLPVYFASALRSLAIVLPLQMGVQAGLFGIGAWRLRRGRQPKNLIWLRTTLMLVGLGILAAQYFLSWGNIFLSPITFPLEAAFGSLASPTDWFFRAGLSLLYLILGIVVLIWGTRRMHLGLAAEESRLASILRQALTMMNFELAETLNRRRKLGATYSSSNLFKNRGIWVLIWKDLIQSWRSLRASQVVRWVYIFFLSIGVFLLTDWAAQLILGGIWMVVLLSLIHI